MRKLMLLFLFVPLCVTLQVGCGKADNTVIEADPNFDPAEETAQEEADAETTE